MLCIEKGKRDANAIPSWLNVVWSAAVAHTPKLKKLCKKLKRYSYKLIVKKYQGYVM